MDSAEAHLSRPPASQAGRALLLPMPRPEAIELARNLHILSALTERLLEGEVEAGESRASYLHVSVLAWLDSGAPRRAGEVARFLSASAPAASQVLARLVRRGLLSIERSASDRRAAELSVTPRGRALVKRHQERKLRLLEDLFARRPGADLGAIRAGLEAAIELLLAAEPEQLALCLRCGLHSAPQCVMARHGHACPTAAGCSAGAPVQGPEGQGR